MKVSKIFLSGILACLCACNCTTEKPENEDNNNNGTKPEVNVPVKDLDVVSYTTKGDQSVLFNKGTFKFGNTGSMDPNQVKYDITKLHNQEIDGFGLAITTAACHNLLKMTQEDRTAFLKETFSKTEGVGSSLIRVAIGASDFCVGEEYTWCDKKGLENFAVAEEDERLLFPILKEIYAINPDVKIIGSPWSCPMWMKGGKSRYEGYDKAILEQDFNSWTTGRLKPSCYQAYADYFVKWIQTMEKEGFDIYGVTMQNEPLNHGNSMSMYMPWKDQLEFIKVLGPTLQKANLDIKIMLFDHNYNYDGKSDQDDYPLHIYADAEAGKWAAGSAWHDYGGQPTELAQIHDAYPEKGIWFTESSIGTWNYDKDGVVGGNFQHCLLQQFNTIFMGTMSRGGKGVVFWNLMLDENRGPFSPKPGSCKTCYGGVTISSKDYKTITKNTHWYTVAHASAVVKPGAKRIDLSGAEMNGYQCQMFLNPDNTVGVLLLNEGSEDKQLVFANSKFTVKYKLPAKSIASLIWQE
jgi:glucosylceramidase